MVIAPAVERKIGKAGFAELSLDPESWKNAYWAREKGLYSRVFDNLTDLDRELDFHADKLAGLSPDALFALKQVLWEGTENWDGLLAERAAFSGKLALTQYTRRALEKFKKE